MRSGLVLPELIVTLVVLGIIAAIAVPSLLTASDAAAVRDETLRVVTAIDAARGAAARHGTVAALRLGSTDYSATVSAGTDTIIAWHAPGPFADGVSLVGAGQPLLFGPSGLAMGVSNRTMTLSKGSASRRVVISRLGRVSY